MKSKITKTTAALIAGIMTVSALPLNSYADQTVSVRTAEQLLNMKSGLNYSLESDIDLTGIKWKPIKGFTGVFSGNGHTISGLTSQTYGLFSTVGSGAEITGVRLTKVNIQSKYKTVGAVVSLIGKDAENVTIDGCYVSGVVASCMTKYKKKKTSTAGGIVGKNNSASAKISRCESNAVVCSERLVGGIAGVNKGSISDCRFGGTIENSYNVDELHAFPGDFIEDDYAYLYAYGGICGFNYGTLTRCVSAFDDRAAGSYAGGIAGVSDKGGKLENCVNYTAVPENYETGGLLEGYAGKTTSIISCLSIKPTAESVQKYLGRGKPKTNEIKSVTEYSPRGMISEILSDEWEEGSYAPELKIFGDIYPRKSDYIIESGRLRENDYEDDEEALIDDTDIRYIDEQFRDYFVFDNVYYTNVENEPSWQGSSFEKGEYFGEIKSKTSDRDLSVIPDGAASLLPVGTKLYKCKNRFEIMLAEAGGKLIPYIEMVEG